MSKPKNKENDILAAAMEVFLEKGFSEASIQDIATKAGIGKGTVYNYFKSKDELFLQSFKHDILNVFEKLKEKELQQGAFLIRLIKFTDFMQKMVLDNFTRCQYYMTTSYPALSPEIQVEVINMLEESKEEGANIIVDILKQGIKEGLVRDFDTKFSAYMVHGMIIIYAERCYKKKLSEEQIKEEQEKLINMIMTGVGTK